MADRGLGAAIIASGLPQPRNFAHNPYPFRASSHFLYLLGAPLQGAVLCIGPEHATLYAEPPDPAQRVWTGPEPSLAELAEELGLEVRSVEQFQAPEQAACLAPVDALSTLWLSELLDRDLEPAHGEPEHAQDQVLADIMVELRLCHDAAAVEQLRQAALVSEAAHRTGMQATERCAFEFEVRAAMEAAVLRQGMTLAYQPIVTVHGEVLHNERHSNPLRPGDLLLADVGAETPEGWAADVTRTWPTSGRFSASQRDVYQVVLAAQQAAIACVRPGVRFLDVHRAALEELTNGLSSLGILRGPLAELLEHGVATAFFPHGVGHLLGLDVHDMEDLGDRAGYPPGRVRSSEPGLRFLRLDRDLEPGMLVTVEPGFYQIEPLLEQARADSRLGRFIDFQMLRRFADVRGIRIEDDVLVTASDPEVLSQRLPKSIEEVEALCAALD